jgi:muconolactone delta-isomerase
MNTIKSRFTELINNFKSLATLSREVIIVLVIAFILFWPVNFKKIMEDAGFKKLDFGFATWESELAASKASLEDANQMIEQYQDELSEIRNNVQVLSESPDLNEETREEMFRINDRIDKTYETSMLARDNIESNIAQQNQILKEIRREQSLPPPPSGQWAVVAGADREVDAAMFEVNRLKEQGYRIVQLWRRDGWYRTVIIFKNREAAENNLNRLKREFRKTAFITNLNEWCPEPVEIEDGLIFECSSR